MSESNEKKPSYQSAEDIKQDVFALYLRTEEEPERKGEIVLSWLKSLSDSDRVLGTAIYGIAKGRLMHETNINISGQVGSLNLGQQYGAVTSTLTTLSAAGGGKEEVAKALQLVADGVKNSRSLRDDEKTDLIEGINSLAEQAGETTPKKFTISALLKSLPEAIKATAGLDQLWTEHGPTIVQYFHHLIA